MAFSYKTATMYRKDVGMFTLTWEKSVCKSGFHVAIFTAKENTQIFKDTAGGDRLYENGHTKKGAYMLLYLCTLELVRASVVQ